MMSVLPQHMHSKEAQKPCLSKAALLRTFLAFFVPVILPFIHIGIISHLWDEFNYKVDRKGCSCPCWDTVFKGVYERGPGNYKHVYFNATSNSFKIWCVTVLAILLVYESVKKVVKLYFEKQIRISMFVLLAASIYPHYYSWWAYFNYWNDEFYTQWNHQLFFSITELASTLAAVSLLDKRTPVTASRALIIMDIAILHIISSGFDQFVDNVISGNGMLHQVLRDTFFMVPDILHVVLPFIELRKVAKTLKVPTVYIISNKEFFFSLSFVTFGWIVCLLL